MKKGIHPQVHDDTKVVCTSCGATFVISSSEKEIHIEICSQCHPVYTGKFRAITSSGRVERFHKKMAEAKKAEDDGKGKKSRKRNLTNEEKLKMKIDEARTKKDVQKEEKKKKDREAAKRAAARTVVRKADKK